MRTTFRIREPYKSIFVQCADDYILQSPARPERFIEKMKTHTGMAGSMFGMLDEQGLEKRNPLIVALGDSVTAGHFESLMTPTLMEKMGRIIGKLKCRDSKEQVKETIMQEGGLPPIEIFDARESYIEKFREMLIDRYELTSVSVINAGIAGDTLPSMIRRANRDVVAHDPDLILINGSLNWNDKELGDADVYKKMLLEFVRELKRTTRADIILLTPNGDLPNTMFSAPGQGVPEPTTSIRAEKIREIAAEEGVCLADVRAVWDAAREQGCPWEELLANRINHPSVEGHEVYAKILMKLLN